MGGFRAAGRAGAALLLALAGLVVTTVRLDTPAHAGSLFPATAFVTNKSNNSVTPINNVLKTTGLPITGGGLNGPNAVAITPDHSTAFVVNESGNSVTPIDLNVDIAGTASPVVV